MSIKRLPVLFLNQWHLALHFKILGLNNIKLFICLCIKNWFFFTTVHQCDKRDVEHWICISPGMRFNNWWQVKMKGGSATPEWCYLNRWWQENGSRSALTVSIQLDHGEGKRIWRRVLYGEFQLVWLHFHFIVLREKWWKWLMKTVEAYTGMIKFGFGIAARRGGCAYFTSSTFRRRLQVFDWHALPSLCLSAAKEKTPSLLLGEKKHRRKGIQYREILGMLEWKMLNSSVWAQAVENVEKL